MSQENTREEINFELIEKSGTLRTSATGWSRELNVIRWNGGNPKFDLRDWSEDHSKCSKGVTLTNPEMRRIVEWLTKRGLDKLSTGSDRPASQTAEAFDDECLAAADF